MNQSELDKSYVNQIEKLKRYIHVTEMLTDLTEAAAAKTAEELEDTKAVLQGMEKQSFYTKKK